MKISELVTNRSLTSVSFLNVGDKVVQISITYRAEGEPFDTYTCSVIPKAIAETLEGCEGYEWEVLRTNVQVISNQGGVVIFEDLDAQEGSGEATFSISSLPDGVCDDDYGHSYLRNRAKKTREPYEGGDVSESDSSEDDEGGATSSSSSSSSDSCLTSALAQASTLQAISASFAESAATSAPHSQTSGVIVADHGSANEEQIHPIVTTSAISSASVSAAITLSAASSSSSASQPAGQHIDDAGISWLQPGCFKNGFGF